MLFTNLAGCAETKEFPSFNRHCSDVRMICMLGRVAHRFEASLEFVLCYYDTHLLHRFIII
jgi:hypothetical protein